VYQHADGPLSIAFLPPKHILIQIHALPHITSHSVASVTSSWHHTSCHSCHAACMAPYITLIPHRIHACVYDAYPAQHQPNHQETSSPKLVNSRNRYTKPQIQVQIITSQIHVQIITSQIHVQIITVLQHHVKLQPSTATSATHTDTSITMQQTPSEHKELICTAIGYAEELPSCGFEIRNLNHKASKLVRSCSLRSSCSQKVGGPRVASR